MIDIIAKLLLIVGTLGSHRYLDCCLLSWRMLQSVFFCLRPLRVYHLHIKIDFIDSPAFFWYFVPSPSNSIIFSIHAGLRFCADKGLTDLVKCWDNIKMVTAIRSMVQHHRVCTVQYSVWWFHFWNMLREVSLTVSKKIFYISANNYFNIFISISSRY